LEEEPRPKTTSPFDINLAPLSLYELRALGSVYGFAIVFDLVKMVFEAKKGLRRIFILKNASTNSKIIFTKPLWGAEKIKNVACRRLFMG
jgi:hypothetical protein